MITLKDFFETVDYRLTEGSEYLWPCFGYSTYTLTAWNGDHDGWSCNAVFSTVDQTVFVVEVCDYQRNRAYRYFDPAHKQAYFDYAAKNNKNHINTAWDDIKYVDLEQSEDWLSKAKAIVRDQNYDTRVMVPINLDDSELFRLMQLAHEQDITLNKLVEKILQEVIDREKIKAAA